MPLYEFECTECEKVTEVILPVAKRDQAPPCSECGQPTTKITTSMTFRLDGSGWSQDGYSTLSDKSDLV